MRLGGSALASLSPTAHRSSRGSKVNGSSQTSFLPLFKRAANVRNGSIVAAMGGKRTLPIELIRFETWD